MSDPQVCPYCNKVFMTRGCEPDKAIEWEGLVSDYALEHMALPPDRPVAHLLDMMEWLLKTIRKMEAQHGQEKV